MSKNGNNGNADFPELGPEKEITLLEFAKEFGSMDTDLLYFQKKMIEAFCVPELFLHPKDDSDTTPD
jgi:hypothetical protein